MTQCIYYLVWYTDLGSPGYFGVSRRSCFWLDWQLSNRGYLVKVFLIQIVIQLFWFRVSFFVLFCFYPWPVLDIRVVSLPVLLCDVCVCMHQSMACPITWGPFKPGPPNLDQRCKIPLLRCPFVCGVINLDLRGQLSKFTSIWACPHHNSSSNYQIWTRGAKYIG